MEMLLSVTNVQQPDEVFEFTRDGQSLQFGRDPGVDIVIWTAMNGRELSRVAGTIWRMDDELWIRNLSTHHDLYLVVTGRPPEPPLPPRMDEADRGPARAIPGEVAFIRAPGGCELLVKQLRPPAAGRRDLEGEITIRAPEVPGDLREVAAALCEPLIGGGQLPATYAQVQARLKIESLKKVRRLVARLIEVYVDEVPVLRERAAERMHREALQLGIAGVPTLHAGVWKFQESFDGSPVDETENERRRALALPDYYEVAHFLVRRRLITRRDIDALPPTPVILDQGESTSHHASPSALGRN